jgi:hypothetical protein
MFALGERDDVYALPIDLDFEMIHLVIVLEHLLRHIAIALAECKHCAFERLLRLAAKQ